MHTRHAVTVNLMKLWFYIKHQTLTTWSVFLITSIIEFRILRYTNMEYNQPETRFQSKITVSELNEAGLSALNRFLICVLFYLLKKDGFPVFHSNPISVNGKIKT